MENELKKLPLRSVPDHYADRVMMHIVRAESRQANVWIAAQIVVTGVIALIVAWLQSAEIIAAMDAVLEMLNAAVISLEQFSGEAFSALNNFRIEPLENIASFEWMTLAISAGIVWLVANGALYVEARKEKLT